MALVFGSDPVGAAENRAAASGRSSAACPQALEELVSGMLRDLPSYANLVATRSRATGAGVEAPFGLVVLVSEPEFEPIDLSDRTFREPPQTESATTQIFFTTLERQYLTAEAVLLQHYHWLFLAPSEQGWQMSLMYSSVGPYPAVGRPPSPPQDSTDGIIGRAVSLWLRDCRARSVDPPASSAGPASVNPETRDPETGPPVERIPAEPVPVEPAPAQPAPPGPAPSRPAAGQTEPF